MPPATRWRPAQYLAGALLLSATFTVGQTRTSATMQEGLPPFETVGNTAPPHLRMLQRLHDQDARAFAHDEAVAPLVPGPRRARRLAAAAAQRPAAGPGARMRRVLSPLRPLRLPHHATLSVLAPARAFAMLPSRPPCTSLQAWCIQQSSSAQPTSPTRINHLFQISCLAEWKSQAYARWHVHH